MGCSFKSRCFALTPWELRVVRHIKKFNLSIIGLVASFWRHFGVAELPVKAWLTTSKSIFSSLQNLYRAHCPCLHHTHTSHAYTVCRLPLHALRGAWPAGRDCDITSLVHVCCIVHALKTTRDTDTCGYQLQYGRAPVPCAKLCRRRARYIVIIIALLCTLWCDRRFLFCVNDVFSYQICEQCSFYFAKWTK